MIRKSQAGFTLVELMITIVIFLLAMVASSQMFVGMLTQFKQQSKVAEANIEGAVGLELLRFDIEQAGYGLPWDLNGLTYVEAANDQATWWNTPNPDLRTNYNDNNNPPRAIVVGGGDHLNAGAGAGMNGSDVLVIKATNVATNTTAPKWTYYSNTGAANALKVWGSTQEDLQNTDLVTVLAPHNKVLNNTGGNYTRPGTANTSSTLTLANVIANISYQPAVNSYESTLIYGLAATGSLSMPFNRADYYIRRPVGVPARCEPTTGVLYKATLNHADGLHTELPLLDCVLDMQIVVTAETTVPPTGNANAFWDSGASMPGVGAASAATLRDQVREVRVYIVAQMGQFDTSFTYVNQNPVTGCANLNDMLCIVDPDVGLVKAVTIPTVNGVSNYRWKIYTLLAAPYNLK